MNQTLRNSVFAVAVSLPVCSGFGCKVEIESLRYFNGSPYTKEISWSAGQSLQIYNVNGNLSVGISNTDKIVVHVQPFTRAEDEMDAKKEMDQKESIVFAEASGAEPVRILASTSGASAFTGYDLSILIPSSFDSSIAVEQKNGAIIIDSVAHATSAHVALKNGPIQAHLGDAHIQVKSGNSDVKVWVSGSAGGDIETSNGSIDFHIPSNANANVSGWAKDGGILSVQPALPSSWIEVEGGSSNAKTWRCNAGSNWTYLSTAMGTSLSDVTIYAD